METDQVALKPKKKRNRNSIISKMLLLLSILLFVLSGMMVFKYFNDINTQYKNSKVALKKVDKVLSAKTDLLVEKPVDGQVIGRMYIEGLIDNKLPIIEGDSIEGALNQGVGHMPYTALPGSGEQVVLSAHRETFFKPLKNVKEGDIIVIELPYGTFKYKVSNTKIIKETEGNKLYKSGKLDQEELVLFTCYPFEPWSSFTERFLVYAYPV